MGTHYELSTQYELETQYKLITKYEVATRELGTSKFFSILSFEIIVADWYSLLPNYHLYWSELSSQYELSTLYELSTQYEVITQLGGYPNQTNV